jgi:hypothetical protein
MIKRGMLLFAGSCLFGIFFTGCSSRHSPTSPTSNTSSLPSRSITGKVVFPAGSGLNASSLNVLSATAEVKLSQNGTFTSTGVNGTKPQVIAVSDSATGKPVLLGYLSPDSGTALINDTTTAIALIMMHPYLLGTDCADRLSVAAAARTDANFGQLVTAIDAAIAAGPTTALNPQNQPGIYQLALQIGSDALQNMALGKRLVKKNVAAAVATVTGGPTMVDDIGTDNVVFSNPKMIYYYAGIYNNGCSNANTEALPDQLSQVNPVNGFVSVNIYPPAISAYQPQTTTYPIGYGTFNIRIESGTNTLDINQMLSKTAQGYAVRANVGKALLMVIDLITGSGLVGDQVLFSPASLDLMGLDVQTVWNVFEFLKQDDAANAFTLILSLLQNTSSGVGVWLAEEGYQGITVTFCSDMAEFASGIAEAMEIVNAENAQIPFIWDLITAPPLVTYNITKSATSYSAQAGSMPLAASFTVSPLFGDTSTTFIFDASATTDANDSSSAIQVRWDFTGNGTWDSDFSNVKTISHKYSQRGSYTVIMEAIDACGLTSTATTQINVSGAYASGRHIVIFRDVLPWQNIQIENLITQYGFTQGSGQNQYEILPSTSMATTPLIPDTTFVIISNSQDQTFYDNYAANNVRFGMFVNEGGSMFWEACDNGWYNDDETTVGGSMNSAGVVIPGGITPNLDYDYYNYLVNPNLLLVSGLPDTLYNNYASHESFTNLPVGTTIYTINSLQGLPTLIEYKYGHGWMMVTGQPLEHGYYMNNTLGLLFPRVVSYVLGQNPTQITAKMAAKRVATQSIYNSSASSTPIIKRTK